MKKLLALVLALSLMLGVASALAEEKVSLLVWESDGVELEFMKAAAAEFQKTHPNVEFEFAAIGSVDAVSKMELDGPAGTAADIFAAPHDLLGQIIAGETALELSEAASKEIDEHFANAAKVAVSSNGKKYGYPVAVETYALFYNKDIIKEAPKTWEEVINFAKEYNKPEDNKYALVWQVADAYYGYMFLSAYGADLFGPEGTNKETHNINTPEAIKGVEYFQSLREKLLPGTKAEDINVGLCEALFLEKRTAAMFITGPWSITKCTEAGLNLGVAPLPKLPDRETPPSSFSGVRGIYVSSYTKHPEEAKAFAEFLLTEEMQTLRAKMTNQIPARNGVKTENPHFEGIMEQANFAKPMPSIPAMAQFWSTMGPAFTNIWNGESVKDNLDAAAQAVEAVK